mgnify:CR=1 FL=1
MTHILEFRYTRKFLHDVSSWRVYSSFTAKRLRNTFQFLAYPGRTTSDAREREKRHRRKKRSAETSPRPIYPRFRSRGRDGRVTSRVCIANGNGGFVTSRIGNDAITEHAVNHPRRRTLSQLNRAGARGSSFRRETYQRRRRGSAM